MVYQKSAAEPPPTSPVHRGKGSEADPYDWLLPPDFQPAKLFSTAGAQEIINAPDSVTIHRAQESKEGIMLMGHSFSATGVPTAVEDIQILRDVISSPTAYTAPSMCVFAPGVLYRMTKGDRRFDLLICFSCEDLGWIVDETPSKSGTIGLSDTGLGSFRVLSSQAFPSDPAFKQP